MEKQLKNYRKPLSILGPLMTVALGGVGLLCPPLLLALPVLVVWLDGRVGGWWATAAMGLVLACLGYVALGTFGAAAGLLLCLPAVVVLGLMRGGMRFGNGLLLSCGVSLAMLAGLFGLAYWALGADPVAWAMAWLRQTLSALPADNLWTYLLSILAAVDEATTADLTAAKDAIMARWGRVDCLINGAGGNHPQASTNADTSFFDLPEEGLRYVFDLNCLGVVLASQVFGAVMADQGTGNIINIGSMAGIRPLTRVVAYGAAKAALTNLTQWMSTYFATEIHPNIRVNGIAPGFLLTEQNRFLMVDKETGEPTARGAHVLQQTPMGRYGQPEEMVGAVVFLSSEAASFVTGVMLPIDGGFASYAI